MTSKRIAIEVAVYSAVLWFVHLRNYSVFWVIGVSLTVIACCYTSSSYFHSWISVAWDIMWILAYFIEGWFCSEAKFIVLISVLPIMLLGRARELILEGNLLVCIEWTLYFALACSRWDKTGVVLSAFWLVFSVICNVFGNRLEMKQFRLYGFCLFVVTGLKLGLVDIEYTSDTIRCWYSLAACGLSVLLYWLSTKIEVAVLKSKVEHGESADKLEN